MKKKQFIEIEKRELSALLFWARNGLKNAKAGQQSLIAQETVHIYETLLKKRSVYPYMQGQEKIGYTMTIAKRRLSSYARLFGAKHKKTLQLKEYIEYATELAKWRKKQQHHI